MKMVFDVESNGLHGEGFAVGWVLIDELGQIVEQRYAGCPVENVDPWVAENVLPHLPDPTHQTPQEIRCAFWEAWQKANNDGATLWADCSWPVEANFLSACVSDDPEKRMWNGPYPLHEIATVFDVVGWDPIAKHERLEGETPHHPTGDAKQSARLLSTALNLSAL